MMCSDLDVTPIVAACEAVTNASKLLSILLASNRVRLDAADSHGNTSQ